MKVTVYVESAADAAAMFTLLWPLMEIKSRQGVAVEFRPATEGDRKAFVLTKVPAMAARILSHDPRDIVVAMPDLYPRNTCFAHETFEQLKRGILDNYSAFIRLKRIEGRRLEERFRVFCFKHELEALILAYPEGLRRELNRRTLDITWTVPTEDQNHDEPPSKIVNQLFAAVGRTYSGESHAPKILNGITYPELAELCPQCFGPFVQFLQDVRVEP